MKTFVLLLLTLSFLSAATAQLPADATFADKRAAYSQAVMVKYPEAADPHSRLSDIALEIVRDWKAKADWRLATAEFPMYLWDAAALRLQLEIAAAPVARTIPYLELKLPPVWTEEQKRQHEELGAALARHDREKESAALREKQAAIAAQYEAQKAEIQRQLEVRLAQIRATNYNAPRSAPRPVYTPPARTSSPSGVTTVSGSGGVYTTQGGAASGATIINTAPGHYEILKKGQPTQRVIITTP